MALRSAATAAPASAAPAAASARSLAGAISARRQQRQQDRAAQLPALGGGGEPCSVCGQRVYPAEKAQSAPTGLVLHKKCFSCAQCGKLLAGGNWQPAKGPDGAVCYYCPAHATQQRTAVGNAQEFSDDALRGNMAAWVPNNDDPPCAMCQRPVAKGERWDAAGCGVGGRMAAFPRWNYAVLHTSCGGCFKCGSKNSLEVDAIGGIYCVTHMKQRIAAAGGAVRASDAGALQATEALFMRDLGGPRLERV